MEVPHIRVVIGEDERYPDFSLLLNNVPHSWQTVKYIPESLYDEYVKAYTEYERIQNIIGHYMYPDDYPLDD